jgi:AraC-like DNA-binding protein
MSFITDLPKATLSSPGASHQASLAAMQSGSIMDRRIETVLEFIASSPIHATLESAASVVWISPSRLRHLFKEQVGLSFHKYLISVRLERARYLLRTTD